MGKLFELLAVEPSLETSYRDAVNEAKNTFSKKSDHFWGHHKKLKMLDDTRSHEEGPAEEFKSMTTTVHDKIEFVNGRVERYFDVLLQKESANQEAVADLKIGGEVYTDLPATFLLALENRLKKMREMYEAIPTLAPGVSWVRDDNIGKNVFRSEFDDKTAKLESTKEYRIVVAPTPEHPAQVKEVEEKKQVGTFTTTRWNGMVSSAEKADILSRLDELITEVKAARQRANTVEVKNRQIGRELLNFVQFGL